MIGHGLTWKEEAAVLEDLGMAGGFAPQTNG